MTRASVRSTTTARRKLYRPSWQSAQQGQGVGNRAFGQVAMFKGIDTTAIEAGKLACIAILPKTLVTAGRRISGAVNKEQARLAGTWQGLDLGQLTFIGGTAIQPVMVVKPRILEGPDGGQSDHCRRPLLEDMQTLDYPGTKGVERNSNEPLRVLYKKGRKTPQASFPALEAVWPVEVEVSPPAGSF
jgi:hypothetical protein